FCLFTLYHTILISLSLHDALPIYLATSRELVELVRLETTTPFTITTVSNATIITRPDGGVLELTLEIGEGEDEQGEEIYRLDTWRIDCDDLNGDALTLSNEFDYGNDRTEMDFYPVVDEIVEWINDGL